MAIRRWTVHPSPETGLVDRNELVAAIMDGESMLWRAGGVLMVMPWRAQTVMPGEMVTTSVLIEWKDRTDAKPQPEMETGAMPAPAPERPPADDEMLAVLEAEVPERLPETSDSPDGLDYADLPEEDDSAIPPSLR